MIFGAIAGALGDAVDSVADVVEDVVDSVGEAAVAVGEAAVDVAGGAGGYLGDGLGYAGSFVDTATGGLAGGALDLVDDTVFDGVDYLTGGVIDVDFDGGQLGVSLGIDGIADIGASVGEDGLTAAFDTGIASADLGLTDDGFALATEAGIDFGPLPYANGHIDISADGDVSINGHVQGTIPVPGGILSGQASGGFVRTDEGWGAFVEADGTYTLPSGTKFGGGLQAGYMEDADGSRTTFGIEGSVSSPGMGSVGGSYGYERIEEDGNVFTHHEASGYAEGFGIKASAEADYVGIETAGGDSFSQWTTDVSLDGLDADSLTQLGASLLGADPDEVTAFLGEAADKGTLGSLLGQLDPATTAAVVERLVGAPVPGGPTPIPYPNVADGPAVTPGVTPSGTPSADSMGDDVLGMDATAAQAPVDTTTADTASDVTAGDAIADPTPDPLADPLGATDSQAPVDPAPVEVEVEAPPEPAPVDDFDQAIAAADQTEDYFDQPSDDLG